MKNLNCILLLEDKDVDKMYKTVHKVIDVYNLKIKDISAMNIYDGHNEVIYYTDKAEIECGNEDKRNGIKKEVKLYIRVNSSVANIKIFNDIIEYLTTNLKIQCTD